MQTDPRLLYLDLLRDCLLGLIYDDPAADPWSQGFDLTRRQRGLDWPLRAQSMIGVLRMDQLRASVIHVTQNNIPGDFIETGVWRGGACIFMKGMLKVLNVTDRVVWAADSFDGLPDPNPSRYPADENDKHRSYRELAVSLEEVQRNFSKYGLLDEQVKFLKGWFKDTLPSAPIEKLAILRLDGDMYESTVDALSCLYDKVSTGGVVIVDDYFLPACRQAVTDFRSQRGIAAPIMDIDGVGSYWIKP